MTVLQLSPSGSFFSANKTIALTVGTTSTEKALDFTNSPAVQAMVTNVGTNTVFISFGLSGAVEAIIPASAAEYGMPIPPNSTQVFHIGNASYVAAIASATGNTLYITTGSTT